MRRTRKAAFVVGVTTALSLALAGCSGGDAASTGGALDEAACDALLSDLPAPTAAASAGAAGTDAATTAPAVSPTADAGGSTGPEKKSITFVGGAYTTTTEAYWKDLGTKFSAANPGYSVNFQIIDWNNIDQQVATMIQTKQYPDVLNQNKFSGWASNGLLQPASALVEAFFLIRDPLGNIKASSEPASTRAPSTRCRSSPAPARCSTTRPPSPRRASRPRRRPGRSWSPTRRS